MGIDRKTTPAMSRRVLRKNGIEQASRSLHEKGIVATRDEIIEAVRIMEAVRRVRERYLTSQMEQHQEED
jgi:hypothetical protein